MVDLSTQYLGLTLRSPIVASASPMTRKPDAVRRLDDAGVGAVVLPSLFEEQITHDQIEVDRMLSTLSDAFGEASNFFPDLGDYNTGPDNYLAMAESVRAAASPEVPVIASLNGTTPGGWVRYATLLEAAGVDALELNVYQVAANPDRTAVDVEEATVELVAGVVAATTVPVAVKLSPYWSSLANFAVQLDRAGAAGLVLFNRFYQPDLDLETFDALPRLVLSSPHELRLPLRWLALLRGRVGCSLAATSGVHAWEDAAKALLVGADVAMMASALLQHGPEHMATVLAGLRLWLETNEYESVSQLVGSAASITGPDPAAFERANYQQTLASFSTPEW